MSFQKEAFYSLLQDSQEQLRRSQEKSYAKVTRASTSDVATLCSGASFGAMAFGSKMLFKEVVSEAFSENNISPVAAKIQEIMHELRRLGVDQVEVGKAFAELLSFAQYVGSKVNEFISTIKALWQYVSGIIKRYSSRVCQLAEELDSMLDANFNLVVRIVQKSEPVPNGWHEMSVDEATQWRSKWEEVMDEWSICLIKNGKVDGPGYGRKITHGSHEFVRYVGERLICMYTNFNRIQWQYRGMEVCIINPETGKALDVSGGSTSCGTNVQLWTKNGTNAQRWVLHDDGSIVNPHSDKALDVNGGACENGTNIQVWDRNRSGAQKWIIQEDGTVVNPQSNKVLDICGGGTEDGTNIILWERHGGGNQKWKIFRA